MGKAKVVQHAGVRQSKGTSCTNDVGPSSQYHCFVTRAATAGSVAMTQCGEVSPSVMGIRCQPSQPQEQRDRLT